MTIAQGLLETEQSLARKDFNLVNATSTSDGFYTSHVTIEQGADYFTKKVTAVVEWQGEHSLDRQLTLSTIVSNFDNPTGGNTCNSSPSGDWHAPLVKNSTTDFASLAGDAAGTYGVTSVDVFKGKLYVGATAGSATGKGLFVFSTSSPSGNPTLLGGIDTTGASVIGGPAAVAVAATSTSGKTYAYVASGYPANFWTGSTGCMAGANCAQLQTFDVTNPAAIVVAKNFMIPTSTPPFVLGSGGQAVGASVVYKNGYLYLGLTKTASGPEFNIFDVHDPANPVPIGNFAVGWSVNAIYLRGNFAYLSTTDSASILTILDLTDPTHPKKVWPNIFASSFGKGKSVTGVGDMLYLAKTFDAGTPEVYTLNNPKPSTQTPTIDTGFEIGDSVNNLLVRSDTLFELVNNKLQIQSATSSAVWASVPLPGVASALDCEGNTLYAGSTDASGRGYLQEITTP